MAIFYKIAQLVINPEHSGSISRAYISQPNASEEEQIGRLLILTEFPAKKPDYQALFNLIVDQVNIAYYQNEQIALLDKLATVSVQTIFESALSKLNQSLYEIWQNQSLKFNPDEFNLTISVIHENKLYFANLGRNKALLIYKPKTPNLQADSPYNLINITKKTSDPREDLLVPNKIISNVVSGMVPTAGFFLFTNEALFEYLSEKQLLKIITTLPPAGAAAQIENLFQQTQLAVPFSLFIIKNQKGQEHHDLDEPTVVSYGSPELIQIKAHRNKLIFRPDKDLNKESIRALNQTEARTAAILKPSGLINFHKISSLLKKLPAFFTIKKRNVLKILPSKVFDRKQSIVSLQRTALAVASFSMSVLGLAYHGITALTQAERRQNLWQKINNFRSKLTKTHLILIIIVLATVAGLVTNLYVIGQRAKQVRDRESFQQLAKEIQKYEAQIASDLSYGNKEKSRESINKISDLLKNFPQVSAQDNDEYNAIKNRHQSNLDLINDVIRLNDLEITGSFKNTGTLANLVSIDQFLLLTNNDSIIRFHKQSKEVTKINTENGSLNYGLTDNNGSYWLSSGSQIIQTGTSNDAFKRFALDGDLSIKGMDIYFNKLYLYSGTDKQIYRYQFTQEGFKDKSPWLKNNEGLDDVRSLAIDSNIYLLDRNNVHKYTMGRKQNFSLSPIEPALTNPTKILTLKEGNLIYILEPEQKRFIIYTKEGKFINQYSSNLFDSLSDFAIDEKYQMMYLLSGTNIYQLKLPMPNGK